MDLLLFCFTEKWWDWERSGFSGRTATLAARLARHASVRRLLVVDAPTSVARRVNPRGDGREAFRSVGDLPWLREAGEKVFVLDQTRVLPAERHDSRAFAFNGALHDASLRDRLRRAVQALGMHDVVSWLSGPTVAPYALAPRVGPVVAYDAVDEWAVHPAYRGIRSQVLRGYDLIRREADLVFAVTPLLARRFTGGAPRVSVLPNAADWPGPRLGLAPVGLERIPRPRVGYVGALQDRLDAPLVAALARRMPETSFVFVGPADDPSALAPLAGLPNVHLVGAVPPEDVPRWLAGFDVCILPHRDTALTRNMDPMKLYEYIAAGKPVVASPLPGLTHPEQVVRRAASADEWEARLREALSGTGANPGAAAFAVRNTWDARVETALQRIRESLPANASAGGVPAEERRGA